MEFVAAVVMDDEREDGEIVDDFDEISDYSMPSSGKSDSSRNFLRAISLSSISNNDQEYDRKEHRRKKKHRPPAAKKRRSYDKADYVCTRKKYRRSLSSSSSDRDELNQRSLRRKLKEAVRINNSSQEMHHNSLRTRLKAMIDPDSQEDEEINALRSIALITSNDVEKPDNKEKVEPVNTNEDETLDDKELAELRLEALKSAVLKKHLERKRRKEIQNNQVIENNDTNNKENAKINIIPIIDNNTLVSDSKSTKEPENISPEDDIDVMRAMLLASMSTKITSTKSMSNKNVRTSTPTALSRNIEQLKQKKPLINHKVNIKNRQIKLPSVKPLIINLKSDSESEPESIEVPKQVTVENQSKSIKAIDQTVSDLLKKQREEFEAKIKTKTVELSPKIKDKSVLKLLSKSQQREYQILKQRLILASRKRKPRKSVRSKNIDVKNSKESVEVRKINLKKNYGQLQIEKNGRLQMKGKYMELGPLMQKVNFASEKRIQCSERVKYLINQLNEARAELDSSHHDYIEHFNQLTQAMENIDKRDNNLSVTNKPNNKIVQKIEPKVLETIITDSDANAQSTTADNHTCVKEVVDENIDCDMAEERKISENVTNYTSPLDNRTNTPTDPQKMLCPYELFGVCKDSECNFTHCP